MSTEDQVSALKAQIKALEEQASLEGPFLAAKEKYHRSQTPKNKATYRDAAAKFQEARSKAREQAVVVPSNGRDVTVVPAPVRRGG